MHVALFRHRRECLLVDPYEHSALLLSSTLEEVSVALLPCARVDACKPIENAPLVVRRVVLREHLVNEDVHACRARARGVSLRNNVLSDRRYELALLVGEREPRPCAVTRTPGVTAGQDAGDRGRGKDAAEENGGAAQRFAPHDRIGRPRATTCRYGWPELRARLPAAWATAAAPR